MIQSVVDFIFVLLKEAHIARRCAESHNIGVSLAVTSHPVRWHVHHQHINTNRTLHAAPIMLSPFSFLFLPWGKSCTTKIPDNICNMKSLHVGRQKCTRQFDPQGSFSFNGSFTHSLTLTQHSQQPLTMSLPFSIKSPGRRIRHVSHSHMAWRFL